MFKIYFVLLKKRKMIKHLTINVGVLKNSTGSVKEAKRKAFHGSRQFSKYTGSFLCGVRMERGEK